MIKAKAIVDGRDTVIIGLSYKNLAALRAEAGVACIHIVSAELNIPFDILVFSGADESAMVETLSHGINADTKVHIDPKNRN